MKYMNKSIEELHELLVSGKVTSDELVKEALELSHKVQDECNAFVTIMDDAKGCEVTDNLLSGIPYGIKDNYSTKTIAHKKSLCEVTGKILFTSTSNCNIKIINNDYFTKLIKNDFNIDVEVKFDTFTYKGHYCKNDGKRYYCLLSKYTETKKNLSFIYEAYEEGDTLVVKEYYLNVDLNNKDLCNLYLNPEYCEKKNVNEPIVVPDEIIINNGVLYQHVFKKIDDKYYYLQSFILSER